MFYHIPKCGGTWVKHALNELGIKTERQIVCGVTGDHSTPEYFPNHTGPAFTFVRHPATWVESWYRFQVQHNWRRWESSRWHPLRLIEDCQSDDFGDFVKNLMRMHPYFVGLLYESYAVGGVMVGWQEELAASLCQILVRLGHEVDRDKLFSITRQNVSIGVARWPAGLFGEYSAHEADTIRKYYGGEV
jgi:hypothetical protein